jgi:serine phosphatase RsbU (regulator of sigma subunit)
MPLKIDVAVVKTNKYASRESGDTVEIVERPGGGISVILADGQGTGRAAKTLSLLVTAKVSALLKEGVRDGASARAANDFLFAIRNGQVSATLDILSVDLKTGTVVITRNSDTACYVRTADGTEVSAGAERPLGIYPRTRPWAAEILIGAGVRVILVSDGVMNSGRWPGGICRRYRGPGAWRGYCPRCAQSRGRHERCGADFSQARSNDVGAPHGRRGAAAMNVPAACSSASSRTGFA